MIALAVLAAIIFCVGQFGPKSGSSGQTCGQCCSWALYYALLVAVFMEPFATASRGCSLCGQGRLYDHRALLPICHTDHSRWRQDPAYITSMALRTWLSQFCICPYLRPLLVAELIAALLAAIIGARRFLKLKSDYLAIATLGFAEVVRIVVATPPEQESPTAPWVLPRSPIWPYYGIFIVAAVA